MDISKCISCKRTRVDEIDGNSVCSLDGELIYDCVDGNKWLENAELLEMLGIKPDMV